MKSAIFKMTHQQGSMIVVPVKAARVMPYSLLLQIKSFIGPTSGLLDWRISNLVPNV